ncbi:MAG: HAD family hydrolase [Verrucomicrobiales bacterium]
MASTSEPPALQAVLFDLDGVLIDSHEQHERAWELWAAELGRSLPEGFFKRSFGMRNETIIPDLLGWAKEPEEIARFSFRKEELYRCELKERGLSPLPGVIALLEGLSALGIPRAVASSTPRENLDAVMSMTGLGPWFHAIITGSDVSRGKPHPEVFLKAAAAVSADPKFCVVIEDAFVGIDAGLAAGCRVLGVGTTHPVESLVKAHRAVPDLTAITAVDLVEMLA